MVHNTYEYEMKWKGVKQWLEDQLQKSAAKIASGDESESRGTPIEDYIAPVICRGMQWQTFAT